MRLVKKTGLHAKKNEKSAVAHLSAWDGGSALRVETPSGRGNGASRSDCAGPAPKTSTGARRSSSLASPIRYETKLLAKRRIAVHPATTVRCAPHRVASIAGSDTGSQRFHALLTLFCAHCRHQPAGSLRARCGFDGHRPLARSGLDAVSVRNAEKGAC